MNGSKNTFIIPLFILSILFSGKAFPSGDNNELPKLLSEGNKLLGKGYFGAALPVWQKIIEKTPDNANANFKIGLCFHNSLDEQLKALPYLKKAVTNMTLEYDFFSNGDKAPYDALYFLAETFLTKNEPDSALKYFKLYQNTFGGNPPINVDKNIFMCINATNSKTSRTAVNINNLSNSINSNFSETNPVVKLDNSMLFFSSRRPANDSTNKTDKITGKYSEDIYIALKGASGKWQEPQPFRYNTAMDEVPLFISTDGLTLYFSRNKKDNTDIYQSSFKDGVWNKPTALKEINSSYNETGMSISGDGKTLYFSSDRKGGIGKFDIYKSEKKSNGKWGTPQNLGTPVNTAFNEISPFINPNGKTLFFSSNGSPNQGMGGYDVFFSELKADNVSWANPQSMGAPINSTRDEINYYIAANGERYYARIDKDKEDKSYDLFEIKGGDLNVEAIDAGAEVVTLTKEMNVTEVMETEKAVEKEVEVVQTVETEVEVIKEVETNKPEEKKVPDIDVSAINVETLDSTAKNALVEKVKTYLAKQIKENEAVIFKTIYFDFNKSNLSLLSKNELNLLIDFIKEHKEMKLEIIGYTDNKGSWETNLRLSNDRAKKVYAFLKKNKVDSARMISYGKASTKPIAGNDSEEGRSKNRRVEVLILK